MAGKEAVVADQLELNLNVNGLRYNLRVAAHKTLLEVLREELGFFGTKEGCGEGECGACTVLIEGKPVNSCMMLAGQAEGKEITTIEGLAVEGKLHPLQESFVEHGAIQCGFCTPGMILSAKALLDEMPHPTENEVRKALSGHICRCTGYQKIIDSVLAGPKQIILVGLDIGPSTIADVGKPKPHYNCYARSIHRSPSPGDVCLNASL